MLLIFKPTTLLRSILLLLLLSRPEVSYAQTGAGEPFNPAKAFCERQTFALENIAEVAPWLDYVGGLRTGRSPSPNTNCPNIAIRIIIGIVGSNTVERADALRFGFFMGQVARAMEPELAERVNDPERSFRYRNDIVLAGFVWLLCPGHGAQRENCSKKIIESFPVQFIQTSPVFCDFSDFNVNSVEWPPNRQTQPLICAQKGLPDTATWIKQVEVSLGQ